MKKITLKFLVALILTYNCMGFSQEIEKKVNVDYISKDEYLLQPITEDIMATDFCAIFNCVPNTENNLNNLTFTTTSSFNSALNNHLAIVKAAEMGERIWLNNQRALMKTHIENQFNQSFSNYSEARDFIFKYVENKNISLGIPSVKNKITSSYISTKKTYTRNLKELNLLNLREKEILSGNINNSEFKYIKVYNTFLKDITNKIDLGYIRNQVVSSFEKQHSEHHVNKYTLEKLNNMGADFISYIFNKKKSLYDGYNDYDKVDIIQYHINYEKIKQILNCNVCYHPDELSRFRDIIDIATNDVIENYAKNKRSGGYSVFSYEYFNQLVNEYDNAYNYHRNVIYDLAEDEHDVLKQEELEKLLNNTNTPNNLSDFLQQEKPDYFGQVVKTSGGPSRIHQNAVAISDSNDNIFAFITPDEKFFYYTEGKGWFLEGGIYTDVRSYTHYVLDKYNRDSQPISWGIQRAADDLGGFILDLIGHPDKTISDFTKGILKIMSGDFDVEKTWNSIINADLSDASYVVATLAMGHLSGPKGKGLVPASETPQFQELLAQYAAKSRPSKLTWSELLELFKKARIFEQNISSHLKTIYKASDGYSVFNQVYLKYNGVVSIVDNLIYDSKLGKFILNESKYGIHNTLSKNQKYIQDAIKSGKKVEIRSKGPFYDANGNIINLLDQGRYISITEILRAHSVNGIIDINTLKSIWKK